MKDKPPIDCEKLHKMYQEAQAKREKAKTKDKPRVDYKEMLRKYQEGKAQKPEQCPADIKSTAIKEKSSTINKKQKAILVVMVVVVGLMLIFPPFCLETQKRTYNYGYSFILDPPRRSVVNIGMLLTQWAGVLFLGGLGWFLAKNTATSNAQPRKTGTDKPFDPMAPCPWNRLWARFIDYTLFLVFFYISVVLITLYGLPLTFFDNIFTEVLAWHVISITLLILYEAVWLSAFGTTPGKALFSIKILTKFNDNLSFKQALNRAFSVLASGFAFLIFLPVIPMFTMWSSYKEIKNTGVAKWDKTEKHRVVHKPVGNIRLWLGIALGAVSVIIISFVHIVEVQINKELIKEQLRQEYLSPLNTNDD